MMTRTVKVWSLAQLQPSTNTWRTEVDLLKLSTSSDSESRPGVLLPQRRTDLCETIPSHAPDDEGYDTDCTQNRECGA